MSRFLDHVVRSARIANAALDPAERRPQLRAAEPEAGADAGDAGDTEDTPDSNADAAQITKVAPAARQIAGSSIHAHERSAARPDEARPASAARQAPARAPAPSEAAPHRPASPLGAPGAPASAPVTNTDASHAPASAPVTNTGASHAPASHALPPRSGDPVPFARRTSSELLSGAWIAAGSLAPAQPPYAVGQATPAAGGYVPDPARRVDARAITETARSVALAAATIDGGRPGMRGPQPPSPMASPAASPIVPSAQSAPAPAAPRIAAPQPPTPPVRELHIEHLDVRVIQEPAPRAAARPPAPARHTTTRGAWRPSARRFLKQP